MSESPRTQPGALADLLALGKPSILLLSVMMAAIGLWVAPGAIGVLPTLGLLLGTGLVVASANALNMVLERDVDGLMARTKNRPLPTGRMRMSTAIAFGLITGLGGTAVLALACNALTAWLGFGALASYVLVYTPLKQRTVWALVIGAFPGAAPPLMGYAAATDRLDATGLVLFGILLVWQLPHFLAIAIYRKRDYAAAGIQVAPVVRGDRAAQWEALVYATVLVPLALALVPLGVAGVAYGVVALGASLAFVGFHLHGFNTLPAPRWARRVFLASLAYLPALAVGLLVDRLVGLVG